MIYAADDDLRFDKHTKAVFDFATLFVHPQHYTTLKRELCLTELNFPMEEPPVFDGVLEEDLVVRSHLEILHELRDGENLEDVVGVD